MPLYRIWPLIVLETDRSLSRLTAHFTHFFPLLSLFLHIFYPFIHFRASTTPLQCLTIKTTTRITTTVNWPTSRTPRTIVTASQTTTTTPLQNPSTTTTTTLQIQSTTPTPPRTMNLRPMQRRHQIGRILTTKYTQPTVTTQATTTIWTCPTPSNHLKMISTPLILNSITRTRSTQPIATTP